MGSSSSGGLGWVVGMIAAGCMLLEISCAEECLLISRLSGAKHPHAAAASHCYALKLFEESAA